MQPQTSLVTKAWFQLVYHWLYHRICVAIVTRRTCLSKQFYRWYIHHGNNLAKKMEKCSLATRLLTDVWLHWRKEKRIWWIWTEANCLTTTSKRPLMTNVWSRVCFCDLKWGLVKLFFLLLPVKLLTIIAFNRSFHNGTWNSPNMQHSFIFLPKEECNWWLVKVVTRVRFQKTGPKFVFSIARNTRWFCS